MTNSPTAEPHEQAAAEGRPVFADVLCAVDGTRGSYAAVEQAAALAGPTGHLTLLAVTAPGGAGGYSYATIGAARAERILEHAAGLAKDAGVACERVIDPAAPAAEVILQRAAGHDLLAIGAPVTTWLGGMFIGGVAESAIGSFPTPLLAARRDTGAEDFAQRILVAIDGPGESHAVVELGGRLARSRDSRITLVHAVGVESDAGTVGVEQQERALREAAGRDPEVEIVADSAWKAIVEAAGRTHASLVVMGSRRLDGLRAVGSVSRRVVHEAPCSVLLVPPGQPPGSR